jgi:hypothetical protein
MSWGRVTDQVGDVLRAFYKCYGRPGEGPPEGVNVTALMGEDSGLYSEIELLQHAINDGRLQRQFEECVRIVDDLANRLITEELLREISVLPSASANQLDQLSAGVFWFSLAASLDTRDADGLPTLPPALKGLNLPIPIKVRLTVAGSLVLRLYVALVYMREGALTELIDGGVLLRQPCCGKVKKLLNCDYLRRIRNALSHGSFSEGVAGLVFRDKDGRIPATPGFLNWLCTWINLVQLQALAATSQPDPGAVASA